MESPWARSRSRARAEWRSSGSNGPVEGLVALCASRTLTHECRYYRKPACANRRLSNIQLSGGWTSCGLPNLSAFLAACPAGSPSDVQPISGGSGGDWGGWEGKCCFVHWPSSPRHQLHDRRSIRPSTKMRRAAYLAFITTRKIPSVLWPNHRSDCSVLYRCKINKSSPKKNWFLFSLVIFT